MQSNIQTAFILVGKMNSSKNTSSASQYIYTQRTPKTILQQAEAEFSA